MELNTTGIDEFYVYIHAKDHFVPYESGRRYSCKTPKYGCLNHMHFIFEIWWSAASTSIKAHVDHLQLHKN